MNRLLAGLPGAGKSHHSVVLIRDALADGRLVVTNVAVDEDELNGLGLPGSLICLSDRDMSQCEFLAEYPGGFFVFDEVRKWLPSGLQQKNLPKNWDHLLSEHRHIEDDQGRSSEVVLISQCASQLPRCVRTLIDNTLIFTKLNKLGIKNAYVCRVYNGPQPLTEARKADLVNSFRRKYSADIFRLYRSHSKGQGGHFQEDGDKGASNVLKGFQFRAVAFAFVAGLASLIWFFSSGWGGIAPQVDEPESVSVSAVEPSPRPAHVQPKELDSKAVVVDTAKATTDKAMSAVGGGDKGRPLVLDDFLPRISQRPESAPLYDGIRQVQSMPNVKGCIHSEAKSYCKCFTWQGTDSGLSQEQCLSYIQNVPFDPWRKAPEVKTEYLQQRLASIQSQIETLRSNAEAYHRARLAFDGDDSFVR